MLAPNTILQNRYRVVRQFGQGGMGTVYEAIDERLDTTVALKETFFTDERLRKQFEREARLLARLHHPALPRVSDHFTEGDGQFLVMQFISGEDLLEMLQRRGGPFPFEDVLRWADQLLDALDYLHTQEPNIIHRDIKPQNLKLTTRGQMILLDFGLAKGFAGQMSRVTTSGSVFGYTPNYAPLEQIQGTGTDGRSDLYSLAATLYHLMTGVIPPDALTRIMATANEQPDPLRPAQELQPQITPAIARALAQAMSHNREKRPRSAAVMRRMLHDASQPTRPTHIDEAQAATALPRTIANPPSAQGRQEQGASPVLPTVVASADPTLLLQRTPHRKVERSSSGGGKLWLIAALPVMFVLTLLFVLTALWVKVYGSSEMRYQAQNNHLTRMKILLTLGADINARDEYGSTALMGAAWRGNTDAAKILIGRGADVNAKNRLSETALLLAAKAGDTDIVRLLLEKNLDVNVRDSKGWTPMMWAAWGGHMDTVKTLLKRNGVDVWAKNNLGETVFSLAYKNNHGEIAGFLRDALPQRQRVIP